MGGGGHSNGCNSCVTVWVLERLLVYLDTTHAWMLGPQQSMHILNINCILEIIGNKLAYFSIRNQH